jgi:hypothetical protein
MAMTMAAQPIQFHQHAAYPNQSVIEDVSDDEGPAGPSRRTGQLAGDNQRYINSYDNNNNNVNEYDDDDESDDIGTDDGDGQYEGEEGHSMEDQGQGQGQGQYTNDPRVNAEQQSFYTQQQQQSMYYHQHQRMYGSNDSLGHASRRGSMNANANGDVMDTSGMSGTSRAQAQLNGQGAIHRHEVMHDGLEDEDAFSDDSSSASIPDENIDFSLTYAL